MAAAGERRGAGVGFLARAQQTREVVAFLMAIGIRCSVDEDVYGFFTLLADESPEEADQIEE